MKGGIRVVKTTLTDELMVRLEEEGMRGRLVSVQHVQDLHEEIDGRKKDGLLDEKLYEAYLNWFDFRLPDDMPDAQSLIVVAVPQDQVPVTFSLDGKDLSLIVPPTYCYSTDEPVRKLLLNILKSKGYDLIKAALPLKLLAVHSGLARYGVNNIAYVDGMGSFCRLVAFYTDLPCERDTWVESRSMAHCENCSACYKTCPSGAIDQNRFLVRAERCITFLNEKPGGVPFPAWVDPSWHNCVVGCLRCQKKCPMNRDRVSSFEKEVTFSQVETTQIIEGTSRDDLPVETARKLEELCIINYLNELPRNLSALFARYK
jgi:epoxyqueuosine reductase